jgi:hypothetical protein
MEIERHTLATGETAVTGFTRLSPPRRTSLTAPDPIRRLALPRR